MQTQKGCGYLRTYVGSDVTSLPIPYATVTVYDQDGQILLQLQSDKEGMIYQTPLPTPLRHQKPPYTRYRVCASATQFQEREISIPFFDGITSYQTFLLIPISKSEKH